MKYTVTLAGRTFSFDLAGVEAELHAVPGTPLRQLVEGDRSDVMALVPGEARGAWRVVRGGEIWEVEVVDERTRLLREMTGAGAAAAGDQVIRAPMPGMVLRLEVEAGQAVEPGTGLVVLEAMKMENEIRAQTGGVVRAVHVRPGQAVEKGAVLLEVEARVPA